MKPTHLSTSKSSFGREQQQVTNLWSFLACVSAFNLISSSNINALSKKFNVCHEVMYMLVQIYGGSTQS